MGWGGAQDRLIMNGDDAIQVECVYHSNNRSDWRGVGYLGGGGGGHFEGSPYSSRTGSKSIKLYK